MILFKENMAPPKRPPGICEVDGCDDAVAMRTWCMRHYSSWRRYGDPLKAKTQHGHACRHRSRAYTCWHNMITRCSRHGYSRYADRGITFDPAWRDFEVFLAEMGEPPDGLTLDRKDNDLGYSKDNCRWATHIDQSNNRENNKRFLYRGEMVTMANLARVAGLSYSTMRYRLEILLWDAEKAVHEPLQRIRRKQYA